MAPSKGAKDTTRLTANINRNLHTEVQIACINQGENMTAVLTNFIKKYVEISNQKGNIA